MKVVILKHTKFEKFFSKLNLDKASALFFFFFFKELSASHFWINIELSPNYFDPALSQEFLPNTKNCSKDSYKTILILPFPKNHQELPSDNYLTQRLCFPCCIFVMCRTAITNRICDLIRSSIYLTKILVSR